MACNGIMYNGVCYDTQTGQTSVDSNSYMPTTGNGSNNSTTFNSNDQKWWQSIIQSLPGVLMGTAAVVQASKNQQPVYVAGSGWQNQQVRPGMPVWIWLVLGVGLIGLIFFVFKGKKA